MNRKTSADLEALYEEVKKPMTVGTVKPGDLEGKTKEKGPKKSGAESTDAKKAVEAPKELQGDTVEDSKKGKKGMSKFDELYNKAIKEDLETGSVEDKSFDSEIGDFPPAGGEEDAAERGMDDELGDTGSESLADLFTSFADIASKIASKFQEQEGGMDSGDMLSDEGEIGPDESLSKEAVESKPAPDGVTKLTSKGNMNTNAVKVTKQSACTKSGGPVDGKPSVAKDTTLGPKTPLKAPGTGPQTDGKGANFFG